MTIFEKEIYFFQQCQKRHTFDRPLKKDFWTMSIAAIKDSLIEIVSIISKKYQMEILITSNVR